MKHKKFITYNGKPASDSYNKVMHVVKKQGYETFTEYLTDKGHYKVKDKWRIKTKYKALPDDAQPIPHCEGYYATPEGEIWKHSPKLKCWLKLAQQSHKSGYKACQVYIDNKKRVKYIHRLIAAAFYGYPGSGYDVHHVNADRHDNHINNLQWMKAEEHRRMPKSK